MAFLFSHDELARLLEKKFPGKKQGVDFWTAHPVKANSPEQIGEVFIAYWAIEGVPVPDIEELAKERDANG